MTTQSSGFQKELIREIFGERPELFLQGQVANLDRGRNFEDFFRQRQSQLLSQFQGAVGAQLAQGSLDVPTPEEFFTPEFLQREFGRVSPAQKGLGTGRFAPLTRFLFGR